MGALFVKNFRNAGKNNLTFFPLSYKIYSVD